MRCSPVLTLFPHCRRAPGLPQPRLADSVRLPASPQGRGGGDKEEGGVRGLRGPVLQQQGGGHPQGHVQVRCSSFCLTFSTYKYLNPA